MSLRAKIVTHERIITLAATPESLAPIPGTSKRSTDAVIQAKLTNTQSCFIGNNNAQLFELSPGTVISLSDLIHVGTEMEFDLDEIFCKVGVNGEGVNILRTEVVTI